MMVSDLKPVGEGLRDGWSKVFFKKIKSLLLCFLQNHIELSGKANLLPLNAIQLRNTE